MIKFQPQIHLAHLIVPDPLNIAFPEYVIVKKAFEILVSS
jgi:hypothetical protein